MQVAPLPPASKGCYFHPGLPPCLENCVSPRQCPRSSALWNLFLQFRSSQSCGCRVSGTLWAYDTPPVDRFTCAPSGVEVLPAALSSHCTISAAPSTAVWLPEISEYKPVGVHNILWPVVVPGQACECFWLCFSLTLWNMYWEIQLPSSFPRCGILRAHKIAWLV